MEIVAGIEDLFHWLYYGKRTYDGDGDFSLPFDLVVVFELDEGGTDVKEDNLYRRLLMQIGRKHVCEFDTEFYERFLLIRGSNSRLRKFAEAEKYSLLLDPDHAAAALQRGDEERSIAKLELQDNSEISPLFPTEFIYEKFQESCDNLFWRPPFAPTTSFGGSDRVDLFLNQMKSPIHKFGCDLDLNMLMHSGQIKSYFPLHSNAEKSALAETWTSARFYRLPLMSIRSYFGDNIALLTAHGVHVVCWLILPGLIGVVLEGIQLAGVGGLDGHGGSLSSRPEGPIIAFGTSLWLVVVSHMWMKKEEIFGVCFGRYALPQDALSARPQHYGYHVPSTIDGTPDIHFSLSTRRLVMLFTLLLSVVVVACLIGASSGIYYIRHIIWTRELVSREMIPWATGAITAGFITIGGPIVGWFAKLLCWIENHRTDREFAMYYAIKLFVFKFVLIFSTFYYLAFGAQFLSLLNVTYLDSISGCVLADCMADLSSAIAVVAGVRSLLTVVFEFVHPLLVYSSEPEAWRRKLFPAFSSWTCCASTAPESSTPCCDCGCSCCGGTRLFWLCWPHLYGRHKKYDPDTELGYEMYNQNEGKDENNPTTEEGGASTSLGVRNSKLARWLIDTQFEKDSYGPISWQNDMCERAMSLLLATMFASSLPCVPAIVLIGELAWLRGRSWQWLFKYQRPSTGLRSAGFFVDGWNGLLHVCAAIASVTNAAFICFCMEPFASWKTEHSLLLFLGLHWSMLVLQWSLNICQKNSSNKVTTVQSLRAAVIERKLIDKKPDESVSPHSLL